MKKSYVVLCDFCAPYVGLPPKETDYHLWDGPPCEECGDTKNVYEIEVEINETRFEGKINEEVYQKMARYR